MNRSIVLLEEGQPDKVTENFVLIFLDDEEFKMAASARDLDQAQKLQLVLHVLEAFERLLSRWIKEATGMVTKRGAQDQDQKEEEV